MTSINTKLGFMALILISLFLISCSSIKQPSIVDDDGILNEVEVITINKEGSFSSDFCIDNNLTDKVIMIESKYCGHCQETLPIFLQACHEKNITPLVLDITEGAQQEIMKSYNINIKYTPTFIFGCNYFVGGKDLDGYLDLLDAFKN